MLIVERLLNAMQCDCLNDIPCRRTLYFTRPVWRSVQTADEQAMCRGRGMNKFYITGEACGPRIVVCWQGYQFFSTDCPPGTRFRVDRKNCVDEDACRVEQRSVDRKLSQNRRQIKFDEVNADDDPEGLHGSASFRRRPTVWYKRR